MFGCDEIYRVFGERDGDPMYSVLRSIDACRSCSSAARCHGWENMTRLADTDGASSVQYSVEHCNMSSCGRVYVDACAGYARHVILASIIAFITTTIIGYFCIQAYQVYKNRTVVSFDQYSRGTGIQMSTDADDETQNPASVSDNQQENATV